MQEIDYKEAYEQEHLKSAELAGRIADLEAKNEELEWKLSRIKNNPLWKASKPARDCIHWAIRQKDRLANCGGPRGVVAKLGYKKREKQAMKQFGTDSFPTPEQAEKERNKELMALRKRGSDYDANIEASKPILDQFGKEYGVNVDEFLDNAEVQAKVAELWKS